MHSFDDLLVPSSTDHPMEGFEDRYRDPVSYILDITYEIWEGKDLDVIRQTYAPAVRVQSPQGMVNDVEAVIAATAATLEEFPDRQNLGEDVIWCDDPNGGFLSSHRILSTATHTGSGQFGAPTGARYTYRVIADCATRENMIYDEWLIRDLGAIVRQAGIKPAEFAQALVNDGQLPVRWHDDTNASDPSIYRGTGNDHPAGTDYRSTLEALALGDMSVAAASYDRAVQVELPGGSAGHGHDDIVSYWAMLRECLPDAEVTIHHHLGRFDTGLRPRAALRWTLNGTHSGAGIFGDPTGAPIFIQGLSHAEFGPRGIVAEWIVIDEIAVWQQVLHARNR